MSEATVSLPLKEGMFFAPPNKKMSNLKIAVTSTAKGSLFFAKNGENYGKVIFNQNEFSINSLLVVFCEIGYRRPRSSGQSTPNPFHAETAELILGIIAKVTREKIVLIKDTVRTVSLNQAECNEYSAKRNIFPSLVSEYRNEVFGNVDNEDSPESGKSILDMLS